MIRKHSELSNTLLTYIKQGLWLLSIFFKQNGILNIIYAT